MKILLMFILMNMGCVSLLAQQTVSSAGGNATGNGTVSYTVGQVVNTTITDVSNGSIAQGVQQPYEISVVTALEEARGISLEIMVYPNPATDFIKIKTENYEVENLSFQLYDINGNLLQNSKINSGETTISMQNNPSATYFLKVTDNNRVVKTFKIIKN